jgi:hypothetical protein
MYYKHKGTVEQIKETAICFRAVYVVKIRGCGGKDDIYYAFFTGSKNPSPDGLVAIEQYDYKWTKLPRTQLVAVTEAREIYRELISHPDSYRSEMDWNLLARKLT